MYNQYFVKTFREVSKDEESKNAQLLTRAGMIDRTMAGVYSLLPLGLRVVDKIEAIIREEMNAAGAAELLMPSLHPKRIWSENGRWEILGDIMYQFKDNSGADVGLGTTHEEVIVDIARRRVKSYRDLPLALYQIQTKFRNEPRAKSGVLRGREFIMKDLYSFHSNLDDLNEFYDRMKEVYMKIFARVGLEGVKLVEASGGTFTNEHSHEFQLPAEVGEDLIFYCEKCGWAENQEIVKVDAGTDCPNNCGGKVKSQNAIEVGNIFRFFDKYGQEMKMTYQDKDGRVQPVLLCSYGLGITRLLGAMAEVHNDQAGLIWPLAVAPFSVVVITAPGQEERSHQVYDELSKLAIETIIDDRPDVTLGEKLIDAKLIGYPYVVTVGNKNADSNELEVYARKGGETKMMAAADLKNLLS